MKSLSVAILSFAAFALSSCGGKKDPEEKKPDGPQTGPGMILDAAEKARDTANDQTRRLEESAPD